MKFSCEKAILSQAVGLASRTVSPKSALEVLEGICVRAGMSLQMTGYNLETGITVGVEAEVLEQGSCVMPARLFSDIIRKLPDDMVTVEVDESYRACITCGISSFTISALPADDYPELPDVDGEAAVRMSQQDLKKLINGTIFAVSDNQSRPIHTGCLFEIEDETATVVAVDGYPAGAAPGQAFRIEPCQAALCGTGSGPQGVGEDALRYRRAGPLHAG